MVINDEVCPLEVEKCSDMESCKYLKNRFGVYECELDRKNKVEKVYKEELASREELIASGKFATGDNYRKDLDKRTYKDAVIDVQAKRKKEC